MFGKKQYKALVAAYNILDDELSSLESQLKTLRRDTLTIDDAKARDYLVRTNYIGKIKDEKLLEDFKKEIEQQLDDNFDHCCTQILNYQLINLHHFRNIVDLYEKKQIIIDTYRPKKSNKAE
jgi:hypothetical protein